MRIEGPNGPQPPSETPKGKNGQPVEMALPVAASTRPDGVEISKGAQVTAEILEKLGRCCDWMRQHGKGCVATGVRVRVGKETATSRTDSR